LSGEFTIQINSATQVVIMRFGEGRYDEAVRLNELCCCPLLPLNSFS
jgi:hypothetical protein